jgi:hypothetical protein
MRAIVAWYTLAMLHVGAITAIAVAWCHLSHLHRYQGPMLISLTAEHGVHVVDVAVLAAEAFLLLALSAVLLAGFSRR